MEFGAKDLLSLLKIPYEFRRRPLLVSTISLIFSILFLSVFVSIRDQSFKELLFSPFFLGLLVWLIVSLVFFTIYFLIFMPKIYLSYKNRLLRGYRLKKLSDVESGIVVMLHRNLHRSMVFMSNLNDRRFVIALRILESKGFVEAISTPNAYRLNKSLASYLDHNPDALGRLDENSGVKKKNELRD